MQRTYVIIDPQHEYAQQLIRLTRQEHGLSPVCVYLDSRAELYKRRHFPVLRGPEVLGHYYLDQMSPQQLADTLRAKYDIVGIMPYFEQALTPGRKLMEALGLNWNDPTVLARFRDKSGLKDYLRTNHPHVPLGASRRVLSVEDVFSQPLPQKFVVKPNDGFANRDVGFFTAQSTREEVSNYFGAGGREAFILEEQLFGTEYAINGQMDEQGKAQIVSVLEYERVPANGKPNVYHRTFHVPQTDSAYSSVAEYSALVMEASGLRRAPFHLELMLTSAGPRLIEVGARFGGIRFVFATNAVHDQVFNHFSMAAHYWLFDSPYKGAGPNWPFYNRISYCHLDGIAERTERVYRLEGVADIEALPEFDGWVVKPEIGGLLRRTVDLYSVPYSFHVKSFHGRTCVIESTEKIKRMLKINRDVSPVRRAYIDALSSATQVSMRCRWMARQALSRFVK